MKSTTVVAAVLLCLSTCLSLRAEKPADGLNNWTSLRGTDGKGHANGTLPNSWSDTDYAWRFSLGSRDVGSVVIANSRAHLLAFDPKTASLTLHAIALEGGASIWKKSFPIGEYKLHARNSYAASTPTIANDHIYISYADNEHTWLRCLDLNGEEIWARDFGPWQSDHGFGTSPAVIDSLVLLYDSQQAEELPAGKAPSHERMIAVDAATGNDRWITPLKATRTSYGIPVAYRAADGSTQIIDAGTGNGVFGIDSKTGSKLWELPVFDKRVVSTPIVIDNLVIASCGSGGGGNSLVAVKIPQSKTDKPELIYRLERAAPYVPTSAVDGDCLMMVSDNGIASRVRIADGEVIWSERIGGNYGSSPIVLGDKMLTISLDGTANILQCGNSFRKLGEVALGGPVSASPCYADGKLLIRVGDALCCLELEQTL